MTLCSNCSSEAIHVYSQSATRKLYFCGAHLPAALRNSGSVAKVEGYDAKVEDAIKAIKKTSPKKSTKVTIDKSDVVDEDVELNSIDPEPTEEVANEPEPGLD